MGQYALSTTFKVPLVILVLLYGALPVVVAQETSDTATFSRWLQEMKTSEKGPFKHIRWFCNDGAILPPKAYACVTHGGGRQHGEWNKQALQLRNSGYLVANILAQINATKFIKTDKNHNKLKQILLEKFLLGIDDGWIFRKARYYRGALQVEDENKNGRQLLLNLLEGPKKVKQEFLIVREAVRLLPHGTNSPSVAKVRQLSTTLSQSDSNFMYIRNKIHSQPDPTDAERIRKYLSNNKIKDSEEYEHLATAIDKLYNETNVTEQLITLSNKIKNPELVRELQKHTIDLLNHSKDIEHHFHIVSELLMFLRDNLSNFDDSNQQLAALDISLALEVSAFTTGNKLLRELPSRSRRVRLDWLANASMALCGVGLISKRQWQAIQDSLINLKMPTLDLPVYREELRFLARTPSWANRWMQFLFGNSIKHLGRIEPLIYQFTHEKLREGPLLIYSRVLDSLMQDANEQAGLGHQLFDKNIGTGLRALNPGLARGTLYLPSENSDKRQFKSDGIYLLPATTAELPPVAGILTLGEGNALSHIQILASNLGIPNIVVDHKILSQLKSWENKRIVLAVSPAGSVQIDADGPHWDDIFSREAKIPEAQIKPNLAKLNLDQRNFISLADLRSSDSGIFAGPKAANLGELKYHFPAAVADGLVIPFGNFRQLLEQNMQDHDKTVFEWMLEQYREIEVLSNKPHEQHRLRQAFLSKLQNWIINSDPGDDFRQRLKKAMQQMFGNDGSYAVFVRSDTNLEDLPGFTGAGLNLTVPNVVGFENVLKAITRVWASPFTARAFAWRQQRMDKPEHVYVSILLMRTVPVEKSGVMVTMDVETGRRSWYSIAANEGVGGAVHGQAAEELRVNAYTGDMRLLAEATSIYRHIVTPQGGLQKLPATTNKAVLTSAELSQLRLFGKELPFRIRLRNEQNQLAPLEVEFGFYKKQLKLFQVRPYLQSLRAKRSRYLNLLDLNLTSTSQQQIDLDAQPAE